MKFSVIINNHNYGRFLGEAIDSVLKQTHTDFELIIVDDGSTDAESHEVLDAVDDPRASIIRKHNGGQLSCFNAAWRKAKGDIITFLDADDRYKPHHLETIARAAGENPEIDFFATSMEIVGNQQGVKRFSDRDTIIHLSAVRTWYFERWYGQPTSALAIRYRCLARFMPLPLEADWRHSADACLVFAPSLMGSGKMFLREITADYRRHDNNDSLTRSMNVRERARCKVLVYRLFRWLLQHLGMAEDDFRRLAKWEFATIERLRLEDYRGIFRLTFRIGPIATIRILNARLSSQMGRMLRRMKGQGSPS